MTEQEIAALIALASTPAPIEERYKEFGALDTWILAVGITSGNERVTPLRAWVAYRRWAKTPMNQRDFFIKMKKKFKPKKATKAKDGPSAHSVYLLNPEPFLSVPKSSDELRLELFDINRRGYEEETIKNTRTSSKK
jgi:hypothetical protein